MPIRINLLAEAQAEEELRRRDPVKRATWMGAFFVFAILVWSGLLLFQAMFAQKELSNSEGHYNSHAKDYSQVLTNEAKLKNITASLNDLHKLATNRFLNGNVLNALQQGSVDDVQLTHFKVDQSYMVTEETKPETVEGITIQGKSATATEKKLLKFDGKATGARPNDSIDKFKEALAGTPYFQSVTSKTNEIRLSGPPSAPQAGPEGKIFVTFSLEFRYPEKTR